MALEERRRSRHRQQQPCVCEAALRSTDSVGDPPWQRATADHSENGHFACLVGDILGRDYKSAQRCQGGKSATNPADLRLAALGEPSRHRFFFEHDDRFFIVSIIVAIFGVLFLLCIRQSSPADDWRSIIEAGWSTAHARAAKAHSTPWLLEASSTNSTPWTCSINNFITNSGGNSHGIRWCNGLGKARSGPFSQDPRSAGDSIVGGQKCPSLCMRELSGGGCRDATQSGSESRGRGRVR